MHLLCRTPLVHSDLSDIKSTLLRPDDSSVLYTHWRRLGSATSPFARWNWSQTPGKGLSIVFRPLIEPTREQIMHLHYIELVTLSPRDILNTSHFSWQPRC